MPYVIKKNESKRLHQVWAAIGCSAHRGRKASCKNNEVLIKVYATTVNRTDCGFRSADYFIARFFSGLLRPKNTILGNEFAGEIEALGKDVTSFSLGDKVFGYNDTRFGAHAGYMIMAEKAEAYFDWWESNEQKDFGMFNNIDPLADTD